MGRQNCADESIVYHALSEYVNGLTFGFNFQIPIRIDYLAANISSNLIEVTGVDFEKVSKHELIELYYHFCYFFAIINDEQSNIYMNDIFISILHAKRTKVGDNLHIGNVVYGYDVTPVMLHYPMGL